MTRTRSLLSLFLLLLMVALPASAQQFGGAIAVGDDDIFVSETRNRAFPGTVYLYQQSPEGMWQEAAQLSATDATEDADRFGRALALDGRTLLVAASAKDGSTGGVYVFEKEASGAWTETGQLAESDGMTGDAFGSSLAIHGGTALVAAPSQKEQTGTVYVFQRGADGTWAEQTQLQGSTIQAGDQFGAALAFDGNVALIGAPSQDESKGAVYVFRHDASAGTWNEDGMLGADGLESRTRFGSALGLREGLAYVGAPGYSQRQGSVFVFAPDAEAQGWTQQTRLSPFEAQRFNQFGSSIAFDGNDVWVGTPGDARFRGAVYQFKHDTATDSWMGAMKMAPGSLDGRASFGSTAAVWGDLAVVGATGVDSGEGAAFIFEREADGTWAEHAMVVNDIKGFDAIVGGEVKCDNGEASAWQCDQIDLVSFLPIKDIGGKRGTRANDIWGWTDPETDREYALVGRSDGTSFVDVTNAANPIYLGDLPKTEGSRSNVWRDIKVYKDHAYVVADGAGDHGMQVFDLTQLRNVQNPPVTFEATAHYDKIASAHNIVINEETGFGFSVGSSSGGETCGGGLHMIDLREPASPTFAGCFADPTTGRRKTGYSHDAQCVIYHGPDTDHQDKEICIGSNETAISISDVTDKDNPAAISMATYPKVAYTHQGWLTEDHRYFYMNDEGDEPQGLVEGTRTLIWDLADLDDPVLVREFIAETTTTDHNLYIKGNLMYQSNYGSGLRILDISNPEDPVEVGYFDTTPHDGGGGSWSNYPYFKSGVIIVTSIGEGLFVLKKKDVDI